MAKKVVVTFETANSSSPPSQKRGLHIRKKLGPKSNMRIR